jgi:hypothetical protein
MPTTKTITLFRFDELSDDAKDKARNRFREHALDYDWWESTYEDAANVGIKIHSFDLDRNRHATGTVEDTEQTAHDIIKEHGEECETYKTAAAYLKERDELIDGWPKDGDQDTLDEKLDEAGQEFERSILEDYSIILQREYEYRMSDEAIDEDIEANGNLFHEDGSPE